jgi:uncharacterized protein involved in exopolysaccharide biosynthesis
MAPSAGDLVWRAKWLILVASVVLAALTYGVSSQLSSTYKSTALVQVSLPGNSASEQGGARASNALASRYARLVRSTPALIETSQRTGVPTRVLSIALTGGTVNAQNIVAVRATGATEQAAQTRANAAAQALIEVAGRSSATQVQRFRQVADEQLAPLNERIARLQKALAAGDPTSPAAENRSQELAALSSERNAAVAANARTASADAPRLQVLKRASSADRLAPHPELYALLALLVTPILAAQFVLAGSALRGRR